MSKLLTLTLGFLLLFTTSVYAFTVPSAPYADPPDANTKLQLSFDEADGSTTTDDESASNFTITNVGTVQTDSGVTKFSNTSLHDGDSDYWSVPDDASWAFGTGLWTIDTWVYYTKDPTSGAYHSGVAGQYVNDDNFFNINVYDGKLLLYVRSAAATIVYCVGDTADVIQINTWYHIAYVRYGTGQNNMYLYIGGVSQGITWNTNLAADASFPDLGAIFAVGYSQFNGAFLQGNMDEFRISNVARDWVTASGKQFIWITKFINNLNPDKIGTPMWSCKIRTMGWWKNLTWKYGRNHTG